MYLDLPHTVKTGVVPHGPLSPGSSKGVLRIAVSVRRLVDWLLYLDLLADAHAQVRTKFLSHSEHGNVSVLHTDTPYLCNASAKAARITILGIIGPPALG